MLERIYPSRRCDLSFAHDPAISLNLKGTTGYGKTLELHGYLDFQTKGGDRKACLQFFKQTPIDDAGLYYRPAQAYDAAETVDRKHGRIKILGAAPP